MQQLILVFYFHILSSKFQHGYSDDYDREGKNQFRNLQIRGGIKER